MNCSRIAILTFGLVSLLPKAGLTQTTPIVATDIREATAPNYGCDFWDYSGEGDRWTLTRVPSGSPSGNDSLLFRGIPSSTLGDNGWGCSFSASLEESPPQGAVRYARWRIKYVSPINWRSDASASGYRANARTAPDKLFILGNTCEHAPHQPTRVILWQYAEGPSRSRPLMRLTQNIGPGIDFVRVRTDEWLDIQLKISSSSAVGANDARLDLYVDNNNEAKPTASARGFEIRTSGWGADSCPGSHIVWGDGSYNPLSAEDPTVNNVTEIADFEYDDEFDANWAIDE